MEKQKILITGASGFVGRNVYEFFKKKSSEFDIVAPTSKELNCYDEQSVFSFLQQHKFDIIFHFAVYGDGIDKTKDGSKSLEYNLRMYYNLSKNRHLFGRMFYTGSGAEYDKRTSICSVKEEEIGKTIPVDQYGLMKYIIGKDIEYQDNIYNLRLFGIFGKYEYWQTKFISNICCKQMNGLPLTIRQNVFFDYLWIEDFCHILEVIMNRNLNHKTYNVCSGERIDLLSLCKLVQKIDGNTSPIFIGKKGLANEYTASNDRLLKEFPEIKLHEMEESIRELYQWYLSCRDQIDLLPLLYQ